jgi:glycosyltransferase involved in cell wall biosynthesis
MKFLFIAKGNDNPSTRYRVFPLAARLRELGHDTEICSSEFHLGNRINILNLTVKSDAVIIQRKLFGAIYFRLLRSCSSKLIFDLDDAIFIRSNGTPSKRRMEGFKRTLIACDTVWAGNNYLLGNTEKYNDKCFIVPTPVNPDVYVNQVAKHDILTLVWIGSSSTRKYLESHRNVFECLGRSISQIQLKVISDFEIQFENLRVINIPWSKKTEAEEIARCHIGIAPMDDNAWTRGKCALKILQYMASSLPVVTSAVGANKEAVVHGETGFHAINKDDWITSIILLSKDVGKRTRLGLAGRQQVEQYYSEEVVVNQMIESLRSLNLKL